MALKYDKIDIFSKMNKSPAVTAIIITGIHIIVYFFLPNLTQSETIKTNFTDSLQRQSFCLAAVSSGN